MMEGSAHITEALPNVGTIYVSATLLIYNGPKGSQGAHLRGRIPNMGVIYANLLLLPHNARVRGFFAIMWVNTDAQQCEPWVPIL